jgi:nucleoid-associated protein YgaU
VTRELKLALIVGFALVLVVTVLISDHLSRARQAELAGNIPADPIKVVEPQAIVAEAMPSGAADPVVTPADATPVASAPVPGPVTGPAPVTTIASGPSGPVTIVQGHGTDVAADLHADLAKAVAAQNGKIEDGKIILPIAVKTTTERLIQDPVTAPLPPVVAAGPIAPVTPDRVHTVVVGDSAFKIAKDYYGDGKVWRKLVKYNKLDEDVVLKVGMQIKVPSSEVLLGKKAPAIAPSATPTAIASNKPAVTSAHPAPAASKLPVSVAPVAAVSHTYTVKKGDTLAEIAKHELGNSKRAREIVELNRRTIKDPDNVPLGAVLTLPSA